MLDKIKSSKFFFGKKVKIKKERKKEVKKVYDL